MCAACDGTGFLWLDELCPLCDNIPAWPAVEEAVASSAANPEDQDYQLTVADPAAEATDEGDVATIADEDAATIADEDVATLFPQAFDESTVNLPSVGHSWLRPVYGDDDDVLTIFPQASEDSTGNIGEEDPSNSIDAASNQPSSELQGSENTNSSADASSSGMTEEENPAAVSSSEDSVTEELVPGRFLLVSSGFFQLAVVVPEKPRPSLSETDVAKLCTTWTHCKREAASPFGKAMRTVFRETCKPGLKDLAHDSCCGICMDSFEEGDMLAALPCASHGCSSVWHLSCIHKWLNQGNTPSCPLCRSQVDCGCTEPAALAASSFALIGNELDGDSNSRFSEAFMGVLFQHLLTQRLASSQDSLAVSSLAGVAS